MQTLQTRMEQASRSLAARDYAAAERGCLLALAQAREAQAWSDYARILLPLQECRRQRRMIAADAAVRLGTADLAVDQLTPDTANPLAPFTSGCLLLTPPHDRARAAALQQRLLDAGRYIELLYAEPADDNRTWRLIALTDQNITCDRPAPAPAWVNRTIDLEHDPDARLNAEARKRTGSASAIDWFLDASEALGDAAIARIDAPPGSVERVIALEQALGAVADHELLHQNLEQAVRAMLRSQSRS